MNMTDNDFVESKTEPTTNYFEKTSEWAEDVFYLLFELKKKYDRSLKDRKIVTVHESETDRIKVSDAFLYLQNEKESLVDAALYEDFIKMSELREKRFLDQILYPNQRLEKFAEIVKKSSTPITYFSNPNQINIEEVRTKFDVQTIEASSSNELKEFIERYQKHITKLTNYFLSKGDIMNIEEKIIEKVANRKIKKDEVDFILTTLEAEILSKMISEKKITVFQENDFLLFTLKEENSAVDSLSSSVLLSPKKTNDMGKKNG